MGRLLVPETGEPGKLVGTEHEDPAPPGRLPAGRSEGARRHEHADLDPVERHRSREVPDDRSAHRARVALGLDDDPPSRGVRADQVRPVVTGAPDVGEAPAFPPEQLAHRVLEVDRVEGLELCERSGCDPATPAQAVPSREHDGRCAATEDGEGHGESGRVDKDDEHEDDPDEGRHGAVTPARASASPAPHRLAVGDGPLAAVPDGHQGGAGDPCEHGEPVYGTDDHDEAEEPEPDRQGATDDEHDERAHDAVTAHESGTDHQLDDMAGPPPGTGEAGAAAEDDLDEREADTRGDESADVVDDEGHETVASCSGDDRVQSRKAAAGTGERGGHEAADAAVGRAASPGVSTPARVARVAQCHGAGTWTPRRHFEAAEVETVQARAIVGRLTAPSAGRTAERYQARSPGASAVAARASWSSR